MEYVENYWIEYCDSGIIHLLFNTTERWIDFHCMNNHTYRIGPDTSESEDFEVYRKRLIDIPKDKLVFESSKFYVTSVSQNKDQLSFYFIPFDLISHPKDEGKFFMQKFES